MSIQPSNDFLLELPPLDDEDGESSLSLDDSEWDDHMEETQQDQDDGLVALDLPESDFLGSDLEEGEVGDSEHESSDLGDAFGLADAILDIEDVETGSEEELGEMWGVEDLEEDGQRLWEDDGDEGLGDVDGMQLDELPPLQKEDEEEPFVPAF